MLDNRTPVVTYRLLVDAHDVLSSNDIISTQTVTLAPDNPDETSLPFFLAVTKDWNGLLASGSPITATSDGVHTLYIIGKDSDGNAFDYVVGSFTVAGGPLVTVQTPVSTPYVAVSGINAGGLSPALINPVSLGGTVNITVAPNGHPVAQLIVKDPSGAETPYEHAGPDTVQHQALAGTVDGPYQLTALDTAGNRTFVTFTLGTSVLAAKPAESTATYSGGSDSFSAQLKYRFEDHYPLAKAELYLGYEPPGGGGTPLRTELLSGNAAELTYAFPDLFTTAGFTRDFYTNPALASYTVKMQNAEGQTRAEVLTLAGYSRQHYSANALDLLTEAGTLPRAMGRTKKEWLGVGVNDHAHQNVSGALLNLQEVGSYAVSVLTGDKPDLSDGVEAELGGGSYYYGVWNFRANGTPSQNCTTVKGVDEGCFNGTIDIQLCEGAILCHNTVVRPPTNLKRYSRVVTELSPAPLTGVFKYLCDDVFPAGDQCESGHQPGLVEGITQLEAWGVRAGYGGGYLSGGLTAQVPAGANVSVKLASWLDLTFENVSAPGFVEATLLEVPSMPGILPLRTLALNSPNVVYTGNVSVSMNYDGTGITDGQADFMEALRINDSAMRDFTKYAVSVNRVNQTAVFTVPALDSFMLEVPSYPAPHAYASSNLNLLSGEPDVAVNQVAPGSPLDVAATRILNDRGFVSLDNAYVIGPTGKSFQQPAAITMRYDKSLVPAKRLVENSLGIYQLSEDGQYLARLGNAVLNKEKGEISAEVTELHSIFVIAGSTYPAQPAPLLPDQTRPVSNLAFGIPAYETGGMVMISSASPVFVDAYDPETAGHITSGPGTKYYLADIPPDTCVFTPPFVGTPGTCQNPIYSSPFTLSPGVHMVWYKSEDNALNAETIRSQTLYVDGDAPVVTVLAAGQPVAPGGTAYITEADSITLTGADPALSGPASGLGGTVFDISTTVCMGFANYPQTPGICREILYTAPFSLPVGTHTLYYSAMDNVGNVAVVKSITLNVKRTDVVNFFSSEITATAILWQWDLVEGATAYQVVSATGGTVSPVLPLNTSRYIQTGLTPNTPYSSLIRAYGATAVESSISEAVTLAATPKLVERYNFGQGASVVIGQTNFNTTTGGTAPNKLFNPRSLAFDKSGNLWVSDNYNHRVLRFSRPFFTNMSADLVLGQKDFYSKENLWGYGDYAFLSPSGLAFDADGNLWVSELSGRVLRFAPPFSNKMNASMAIGVGSINSTSNGVCAQNRLDQNTWGDLAFDKKGSMWVADFGHNRVMRFSPPFATNMNADLVLGKPHFTACGNSYPYVPSERDLYGPMSVETDSAGSVWVADYWNDRVLQYREPFYNGMPASTVLGQRNFVENNQITGRTSPNAASLSGPAGLEFDSYDSLYVADAKNNRVVKYPPPFGNGMDATLVIGQADFNSVFNMNLQATFSFPLGVESSGFAEADEAGRLWVADTFGNRVMMFEPVRQGVFSEVGSSSFTVSWEENGNPAGTGYVAELSDKPDFSQNVHAVEAGSSLSAQFVNLSGNTRYYARVKARNSAGASTMYAGLGSVLTKPALIRDFAGLSASPESILWTWGTAAAGVEFRIYSTTGGAVSPVLTAGTTNFLQTGLSANQEYANYIRATNSSGEVDSEASRRTTLSARPIRVEPFVNGQNAELVIGQADFVTATYGTSATKFSSLQYGVFDSSGSLWALDRCRVLRFSPPFTNNMSADLVLGQTDFVSLNCATSANAFSYGSGLAFSGDGALWVSDTSSSRVLRFSPPFTNGKAADMVIGQGDFSSSVPGTAANKLNSPDWISISKDGRLWVADEYNQRILRFSPPFSTGMNADLVLGQPNFTARNEYQWNQPSNATMFGARQLAFDGTGNLWVPDLVRRRILMFSPPFTIGMAASFVLGQPDFAHPTDNRYYPCPVPTQSNFCAVNAVAFDEDGNLYLTESNTYSGNNAMRVLKYKPPFRNIMDASLVLGQPDFTSSEYAVSQNRSRGINGVIPVTSGGKATLWVLDGGDNRILRFGETQPSFRNVGASSMTMVWAGGINPNGTEYYVQAATTSALDAGVLNKSWTTEISALFDGLLENTTYFARVKSRNSEGIESGYLYLGYAPTPASPYIIVTSTMLVDGNPEVSLSHISAMTVAPLDAGTAAGAIAIGSATGMGLTLASNLYVVGPDGAYDPPAQLTFYYSTATLAGLGLTAADISVYEFFSDGGWVLLPGQQLDEAAHGIIVPVSRIASVFGIFGIVKDRQPPVTEFSIIGSSWSSAGAFYVALRSSVSLGAYDPIAYGTATGVEFTEFRIASSSMTDFSRYVGPFALSAGFHEIEYHSTDNAGNKEAIRSLSVQADGAAPVSALLFAGTTGQGGWYTSPVWVTLTSSDDLSGVLESYYSLDGSSYVVYSSSFQVPGEGDHAVSFYAEDNVRNTGAPAVRTFKIDVSTPSPAYSLSPAPNAAGWNKTPVDVVFRGSDSISGIAWCSSTFTVSGEGLGIEVAGYCVDYAGWSSTTTAIVNIDTGSPAISYTALPVANEAGWNNTDVTLKFSCEDTLSGIKVCPADLVLATDGAAISTSTWASDNADNYTSLITSELKLDRSAPVSTAAFSGAYLNGWYAGVVGIVITSTDALSGIKQVLYSLDDGEQLAYTGPLSVSGEGRHTLKFYAEDNAGNAEAVKTISFHIDTSAPIVAYSQTPAANMAGWNNSSVNLVFSGTDTFSGIEGCSSGTVAVEGAARSVPGWCRDLAGNIGYATATLNIDMTPAGISIASPQAGQTFIATRGQIDIGFAIADNLDPAPGVEAFLVQLEDKGSPRGQRPAKISVASGQAIEPLDIDDGVWQLMVSATDFALNASSAASGAFEVIHDVLAPRSELAVSGALYGSAGGTFVTSAAKFGLASIDDLVSPEDGIGLGVKYQSVGLKSGGLTLKELTFLAPAPQPGMVFVSTFSLGSLGNLPDGSYHVSYAARDMIGNTSASVERRYLLDNTAPLTQYFVAGTAQLTDGKLYLNSTAALRLSAVDVSSGGVASGLMLTKYRLDGCNWLIYSSSFALSAAGAHTLEYYSLDNVQNAESIRTLNIVVDNTAPATAISVGEPQFNVFGLWIMTPETPVTLTAADAGAAGLASGVKGIYYELIADGGSSSGANNYTEPFKIGAQGTYTVRYWSVDNAGNAEMPKELRLMVSSLQSDALDAVEGLAMTGSADIAGTVKSNKVVSLGGNARILGDVSASTITVTGNAQITGQRFAGAATLTPAPLYMPAIVAIASSTNNNNLIPAKYLVGGKLVVSAKDEITLSTGIYYFSGIELKGGASVVLNGKVDILVAGDVAIGGGSSFNAAGTASRLNIFLSTTSVLNLGGGASLAAYVYAPYAELKLAGNALLGGHYFVRSAVVSGNGNIMQAGESLPSAAPASGGGKKVSAFGSSSSYSVLAGPDPEFKLGEVYVYPNPAKNGQTPTIHLECGIADSVNIKIYTVSGREAHEYTITSAPAALDDGNGLSYAYEYAWNGRIPSGVYYYFIEAERAGKKIKKTGKFAVVR